MARPPKGQDVLEQAMDALASAETIQDFRAAQAVVLPLMIGRSLAQTAQVIGVSTR